MARKNNRKSRKPSAAVGRPYRDLDAAPEVDLHALTVVEALPVLDGFLHDSFQAGHYRVRVNHGKGTGVLRTEVSRYLSGHPLVQDYRVADLWQGGSGVTVVDLSYR